MPKMPEFQNCYLQAVGPDWQAGPTQMLVHLPPHTHSGTGEKRRGIGVRENS